MKTAAEQQIAAPRQRVWEALNDPEILRASIPGCQSLEKQSDDRFTAALEVKVGPIGARFKGAVSLTDLDPPSGYTLILDANGGIAGSAKGRAKVHLREHAGGTLIIYEIEAQVGAAWRSWVVPSSRRPRSSLQASSLLALAKSSVRR